jgi:hypothetical protein
MLRLSTFSALLDFFFFIIAPLLRLACIYLPRTESMTQLLLLSTLINLDDLGMRSIHIRSYFLGVQSISSRRSLDTAVKLSTSCHCDVS